MARTNFLRRAALRRPLALAAGILCAALGHEALLRAAYVSPGQYVLDPVLGVDRVPHSQVLVTLEGGARLGFDRYGLNNDDAAWDRPARRIGVLGDSFTEATEVARGANFVSQLGAAWPEWAVLNLGRAAMTPPQAAELHRRIHAREGFDLLLLALSDNDLDELAASPPGEGCTAPARPVAAWRRHFAAVVGASSLLSRMQLRLRSWREGLWPPAQEAAPAAAPAEDAAGETLAARLAECLALLAARQPVAMLLLPGSRLPASEADWQHGLWRDAVARRAAARAGVRVVSNAWIAFGRDPLGDGRLVNGFANHVMGTGHLNPLGHAHLASLLAASLAPLLREPPPGDRPERLLVERAEPAP